MGKKQTIAQQAKGRLLRLQHYGDKKHEDKKNNNGKPAMEKIYSIKTMDNYIGACPTLCQVGVG